jgi:GTP-binding protein
LLDLAFPLNSPEKDYEKLLEELKLYNPLLLKKQRVIAGNKIDLLEAQQKADEFKRKFDLRKEKVFLISGLTGEGLKELIDYLFVVVSQAKEEIKPAESVKIKLDSFKIKKLEAGKFEVSGGKIARMVEQVDWGNPEAVDYFFQRLRKLGWLKELSKKGIKEGDRIVVGKREFIFKP